MAGFVWEKTFETAGLWGTTKGPEWSGQKCARRSGDEAGWIGEFHSRKLRRLLFA
jgi:hypothetical protein